MKKILLFLLLASMLAFVACNDDDNDNDNNNDPEDYAGEIVPIDKDWQWVYLRGDATSDTLSYTFIEEYVYNGYQDWYRVCWAGNNGDNPAIARLDSVGLYFAWPGWRGEGTFDRMGRKISDAPDPNFRDRELEYYIVMYPIAEGDTWDVFDDGTTIAECVDYYESVTVPYAETEAIHYDWDYGDNYHEYYVYRPGMGWLKTTDSEESIHSYELTDIIKPASAGRNPLAP